MPDKKMLENLWLKYRKLVVPAQASEIQVRETRWAFYAGLQSMFEILTGLSIFPEETTVVAMSILEAELKEFEESVLEHGGGR